jgi:hypothetical protein
MSGQTANELVDVPESSGSTANFPWAITHTRGKYARSIWVDFPSVGWTAQCEGHNAQLMLVDHPMLW